MFEEEGGKKLKMDRERHLWLFRKIIGAGIGRRVRVIFKSAFLKDKQEFD